MSMGHIQTEPLDAMAIRNRVASPEFGGLVVFEGVVRDHHKGKGVTRLVYTSYDAMAESMCAELVAEGEHRWPVKLAVVHRVGDIPVGETAIVVVAAAAHRGAAFEACRWLLDSVKSKVPIWKREYYSDGTTDWVDPTHG
jgi:molybdopterin synthase catalytic subunit